MKSLKLVQEAARKKYYMLLFVQGGFMGCLVSLSVCLHRQIAVNTLQKNRDLVHPEGYRQLNC